jgi:hypothetical protein
MATPSLDPHSDEPDGLTRRTALGGSALLGAALGLGGLRRTAAQDPDAAAHPLVGAWLVADPADPARPMLVNQYWADGNALFIVPDGHTDHGVWTATGPRTAELTLVGFVRDPSGAIVGLATTSGAVEVDATGETFSGEADFELAALDGTVLETGRGGALGTRIALRPMGPTAAGTPTS